jgi:hypothetical protein
MKIEDRLPKQEVKNEIDANHMKTPKSVKSLYYTSYSA